MLFYNNCMALQWLCQWPVCVCQPADAIWYTIQTKLSSSNKPIGFCVASSLVALEQGRVVTFYVPKKSKRFQRDAHAAINWVKWRLPKLDHSIASTTQSTSIWNPSLGIERHTFYIRKTRDGIWPLCHTMTLSVTSVADVVPVVSSSRL